jgi:uncharacterized protein (TIGR03435 family)
MTFSTFWNQGLVGFAVNHLWQSTLGVLVAWLLTQALKQNQARTRYWVWMVASVKLLVPFSLFVALGEWLRPATTAPIESPQLATAIVKMSQPFVQNIEPVIGFSGAAGGAGPVPHHSHPWAAILLAAWLCGFLFFLVRWACTWWAIRATVRSASPMSLSMDVPVFSSSRLLEPGVFGIFRPVLLLPEKLMHRLSAAQLRSILAHEMCHIRRRDNLTAAIHMAVEAIFWFHPAVWWIEAHLIEERERACDEAVLQLGNHAEVYAEGILNVCKFYTESPMVCMSGVTGSDLKRRILRIMTEQVAQKLDLSRKLLLGTVALLAVSVPVVFGVLHPGEVRAQAAASQGLAGTWQGLLHRGTDQRVVLKISNSEGGAYKAVFYNLELGQGEGLPVTTITLDGSTLKLTVAPIRGAFQGKVGSDGTSISGNLSEAGAPQEQPLLLTRATPETEWTIPQPPPRIRMDANAHPTFEVATIKPSKRDEQRFMLVFRGNTFETIGTSLSQLITMAYEVHAKQIVGAPAWFETEKFDITAKPDIKGTPSKQQLEAMVQTLIADRFNLTFHHDQKELPVYVLSVAKTGSKLTDNGDAHGLPGFGLRAPGALNVHGATMSDFASMMQQTVLDRPVLDKTGLTGRFDFNLDWTPDDSQFGGRGANIPPPTDGSSAPPNLYTALQEQIGLKLEAAKAPADVIVIDHVETPSEN